MKIVLKDGTEIQNATIGRVRNLLELIMSKADAVANLSKFMDPDVMSEIEWYHGIWKEPYIGFSRFSHLENPKEDEMRVWMEGTDEATVGEKIPTVDKMYIPKGLLS